MSELFKFFEYNRCCTCGAHTLNYIDVSCGPLGDFRHYCPEHETAIRGWAQEQEQKRRAERALCKKQKPVDRIAALERDLAAAHKALDVQKCINDAESKDLAAALAERESYREMWKAEKKEVAAWEAEAAALRVANEGYPGIAYDFETLKIAARKVLRYVEHDGNCDLAFLDDDGKHKACSCGLSALIDAIARGAAHE